MGVSTSTYSVIVSDAWRQTQSSQIRSDLPVVTCRPGLKPRVRLGCRAPWKHMESKEGWGLGRGLSRPQSWAGQGVPDGVSGATG